jgi:hypothetical protein
MLFRVSFSQDNAFYEEEETIKSFNTLGGAMRRYFTWPVISNRITFQPVLPGLQNQILSVIILGGTINECRLQEELPGRTWWKLIKSDGFFS